MIRRDVWFTRGVRDFEIYALCTRAECNIYSRASTFTRTRNTYQVDSPTGLDLKLAKIPPEDTRKLRRSGTILRGFLGVLLGPVLIALGRAS